MRTSLDIAPAQPHARLKALIQRGKNLTSRMHQVAVNGQITP
jgi:hypothetical protein